MKDLFLINVIRVSFLVVCCATCSRTPNPTSVVDKAAENVLSYVSVSDAGLTALDVRGYKLAIRKYTKNSNDKLISDSKFNSEIDTLFAKLGQLNLPKKESDTAQGQNVSGIPRSSFYLFSRGGDTLIENNVEQLNSLGISKLLDDFISKQTSILLNF